MSHPILLHKLYHYGIRRPTFSLLESYLSYRCQFVSLNNSHSSSKPINVGVPQGSILGLLLFLIYVNDLSNSTSCNPCLFADDTCLVVSNSSFSSLEQRCNAELENLKNWCNANKLQINPKKSISIYVPPKLNINEEKLKILYNNCTLACCVSSKYLGVIIDNKLNFQSHIHAIENKVARAVGILSKVRYVFPSSTLPLLYFALIHPHLLFGLVLWGNIYSTYLAKLQNLQNKAIRIISNCNYRSPITPHFYKLGVLKIADQYTFEVGKMMYQHSKQALPPCISSFFSPISSIHSRRTRSSTKKNLYIPKFSFSRCQKSIKYQGAKIWNSIPINIRDQNFNKFKSNFKNLLLEKYRGYLAIIFIRKYFLLYFTLNDACTFIFFYVSKLFLLVLLLLYSYSVKMLQRLIFSVTA